VKLATCLNNRVAAGSLDKELDARFLRRRSPVNRLFRGATTRILAIRADLQWIAAVDAHLSRHRPELRQNRSEYFRQCVEKQMETESR
jgi:hypothetical protein